MRVVPRAVQNLQSDQSARFTVAHRLLREHGFDHVIRAENMANGGFKIFFVSNDKKNARLGIIAAKKTLAGAVDRNHAKRIIREAFRHHSIRLRSLDLVVMVRCAAPQGVGMQTGSLNMLFSWIENGCAES